MSAAASASTTLLPHLAAVREKATVVLASKSPRRVEIMGLMGLAPPEGKDDAAVFRVVPSGFPEDLDKSCKSKTNKWSGWLAGWLNGGWMWMDAVA